MQWINISDKVVLILSYQNLLKPSILSVCEIFGIYESHSFKLYLESKYLDVLKHSLTKNLLQKQIYLKANVDINAFSEMDSNWEHFGGFSELSKPC